jgi:hypothetical protein
LFCGRRHQLVYGEHNVGFNVVCKAEVILKDGRFHLVVEKPFAARKGERVEVCRGIRPRSKRLVFLGPIAPWNERKLQQKAQGHSRIAIQDLDGEDSVATTAGATTAETTM